jgi:hypothetical protein
VEKTISFLHRGSNPEPSSLCRLRYDSGIERFDSLRVIRKSIMLCHSLEKSIILCHSLEKKYNSMSLFRKKYNSMSLFRKKYNSMSLFRKKYNSMSHFRKNSKNDDINKTV